MRLNLFSKNDSVLLVGEGNFSFSVCLIKHKIPVNVIATCFEKEILYKQQQENIEYLKSKNTPVFLNVDATKLHENPHFCHCNFSKIVFNFPHVGGKMKIQLNRELLKNFFTSAANVIAENGLVIVSLCQGQGGTEADKPRRRWDDSWQITEMAAHGDFVLTSVEQFQQENFKEYRCIGYRSQDVKFELAGALVHVFTKVKLPFASINDNTAVERLSLVPLKPHSQVFVPITYAEFYCNYTVSSANSAIVFVNDLITNSLKSMIPTTNWTYLTDDDVPVYVEVDGGIQCEVDSAVTNQYLRRHPIQIFGKILQILKESDFENQIILFPGMYFSPILDKDFTRVPVSIQFVISGRNLLKYIIKVMENLIDTFKAEDLNISSVREQSFSNPSYESFITKKITKLFCENKKNAKILYFAEVYFIDYQEINVEICVINTQEIVKYFFESKDEKEIFSENSMVVVGKNAKPSLKQNSLYPNLYTFDVTLRYVTEKRYPEEEVYKILWLAAGFLITQVDTVNEYTSDKDWSSTCYRISYKSLDKPLFRRRVIDIHSKIVSRMLELGLHVSIG